MARRLFHVRLFAFSLWLLVFGTFCSSALPVRPSAHPKRNDEYKRQVEKLEEDWRIAQLNNDVALADRLLSDDYIGITMNGQVVTKAQQLDSMRNRTFVLTKVVLDDVKVKLVGSTAIVTSLANVEGTYEGASIRGQYRYTRVYTRLPSGNWKITNFEATRVGPLRGDRSHRAAEDRSPSKSE